MPARHRRERIRRRRRSPVGQQHHRGRCLDGPLRATPVMLLAYSAFLRGDSELTSVATSVALHADPGEITARLIYAALDNPLLAGSLDINVRFGAAAATDLGVTIDHTSTD
ncbi:DUF4192 family protein [Nocardia bovistercoris]